MRFRRFRDAYLTIDRRVLGGFRILYGFVLLWDLGWRARFLELCYSNDGILTNHYLLFAPQAKPQFSIYTAFSTPAEVGAAFAVTAMVYAFYTLGLCTRLMQILVLVLLTSLNARNLFFEDGGVSTLILLAVWTLFLPLGDRFALDRLLAEARLGRVSERVRARAARRAPFVSLAVLAIVLQIAVIYWLNAVHKTGPSWREGDAVHLVLWQNRVATSLASFIAYHEPAWFSPLATRGTIVLEALMPVLVLSPWQSARLRSAAFVLAVLLHGGIALLILLGPFSYAMLCLVFLVLPGSAFDAIGRRLPARWRRRALGLRARAVRRLSALLVRLGRSPREPILPARAPVRAWLAERVLWTRELAVALVMLAAAIQVLRDNRALPKALKFEQPPPFAAFIGYTRMLQGWHMFAPDAPRQDGMLVVDATTAGGRRIDPFTGEQPDFELGLRGPVPHAIIVSDYLFAIQQAHNRAYLLELQGYLARWHEVERRPASDRIVRYEIWWLSHDSPPRGSTEPGPVHKRLVLSGP